MNASLSIIIVNYNVKHFLDQCLISIRKAGEGLKYEVIVVDNASTDQSDVFILNKHPWVKWIQNDVNVGFSKANNQGLKVATGDYLLLLNPDTLVNASALSACIDLLNRIPKAGAVGVKMIDGSGAYLPESKRGLPTPFVAFCRFVGLGRLFPKSKLLNRYYLGHLSQDENHEIDVLCGAFMMISREVWDTVGGLDEAFFMYGEDIDWSYRIQQQGYSIHYLGAVSIVHYKGESTKKASLNHIRVFHKAMLIFANKHFANQTAWWFRMIITLGVYVQAFFTLLNRKLKKVYPAFLDFISICLGLWVTKELWENYYFEDDHYFPNSYLWLNIPLYALIWTGSLQLISNRRALGETVKWIGAATILLLAIYGLLPLEFRPSRFLVVAGALFVFGYARLKFLWSRSKLNSENPKRKKRILIVGREDSYPAVLHNLEYSGVAFHFAGYVAQLRSDHPKCLGTIDQLTELVNTFDIEEIIFDSEEVAFHQITHWMTILGNEIAYRISGSQQQGILGSLSKNHLGKLYTLDTHYRLEDPYLQAVKRIQDIVISIGLFLLSPFLIWRYKHINRFFGNLWSVLVGKFSWVSYDYSDPALDRLPKLRKGVLTTSMKYGLIQPDHDVSHKMNQLYAKEYSPLGDVTFVIKSIFKLDK